MTAPNIVKTISAILGAVAGFLWGDIDGLIKALLAFICLDYITGVIVAIANHKLNSQVGFKGIAKKAIILIFVAVAHIVDYHVLGGSSSVFRSAVCCLYIANEGMSIIENAGELGMPLPKRLVTFFEQLRDNSEKEE